MRRVKLESIDTSTLGGRLRWSRVKAGFGSAAMVAERVEWAASTVLSHENLQTETPPLECLLEYERLYRCDLYWVITGRTARGEIHLDAHVIMIDGAVGAGAGVSAFEDEAVAQRYGAIAMPGDGHLGALIVEGDSQQPRWRKGEVIVYDRRPAKPEDLIGCYAIVRNAEGERLIKIIRRGRGDNRWNLESHNAELREDVFLIGAHRIVATIHRHPASPEDELPAPVLPRGKNKR